MRVGLLGPLQIERDGHPVAVGGGRLRALLARLALDAGRPVTTGALVDAVWDDELPADQQHALQSLDLARCGARSATPTRSAAPGGYRLSADGSTRTASSSSPPRRDALRNGDPQAADPGEALELWRGPALADLAS